MSSKSLGQPNEDNALIGVKKNIPVITTDLSIFDNGFCPMRERFKRAMQQIDQQATKRFSSDLMSLYGETSTDVLTVGTPLPLHGSALPDMIDWDVLKLSPLVVGEGNAKSLKLQFDVSQFDASEINVEVRNDNMLIVTASHDEKTADSTVNRKYNRHFKLPPGVDLELLEFSLSRDGVLTVEAPLPLPPDSPV